MYGLGCIIDFNWMQLQKTGRVSWRFLILVTWVREIQKIIDKCIKLKHRVAIIVELTKPTDFELVSHRVTCILSRQQIKTMIPTFFENFTRHTSMFSQLIIRSKLRLFSSHTKNLHELTLEIERQTRNICATSCREISISLHQLPP